ncbi:MAG: threonine synthase [Clostridiales bacterium]|nr:threonine synthase [Clostridiales bacterium]
MKYTSTRDGSVETDGASAVIDGISADGGLYVPVRLPKLDYTEFFGLDYIKRADKVLRAFFDFDVSGVAQAAYGMFDTDEPAPVVKIDDRLFVLELWHGRTHAFKDMALSVLPRLLVRAKSEKTVGQKTLVLVATSGDTGKAALEGFKDVDGTEVCVFYPTDGVSRVQKLAMQTQSGDNVRAVGITGNFDDAQTAVKAAFRDGSLKHALGENNITMSSANSINIGRLVPQIAYYYSAYCDMVDSGEIKSGDKIDFIVPTGNFGNILAGWYAMQMGLPVNKLVCASNRNNVLTDFIETGVYDVNREFYKTESPSMDILVSSNLERLVYETSGRDARKTAERYAELKETGRFSVEADEIEKIREVFSSDYANDEDIEQAIAEMFDEYGYLIDTHTAAAYAVAMRRELVRPTVVVSTANPYKFAPAVLRALGEKTQGEATADTLRQLEDVTAMDVPQSLADVFTLPIRFADTISPDGISDYILRNYGK